MHSLSLIICRIRAKLGDSFAEKLAGARLLSSTGEELCLRSGLYAQIAVIVNARREPKPKTNRDIARGLCIFEEEKNDGVQS